MIRFRIETPISRRTVPVAAALLLTCCIPTAHGYGYAQAADSAPSLEAKFDNSVNTKSAKVGDNVVAKETKVAKLKDGTSIPKGAKLFGKVVTVQSLKDGNGTSSLAIKFDHIQIKGKPDVPIQGLITAIGPAHVATADDSMSSEGSAPSRGGMGGGGGSRSAPAAAAPVAAQTAPTQPTLTTGSTLDGVSLALRLDASGATELRAEKKDIKLDSDVIFKLQVQ